MNINNYIEEILSLRDKYELSLLYLDYTNNTLICRLGFTYEIFIQVYINIIKEKVNLALVIKNTRVYGIDKESGFYHKHPIENPELHVPTNERISIEEFILKSIEILRNVGYL